MPELDFGDHSLILFYSDADNSQLYSYVPANGCERDRVDLDSVFGFQPVPGINRYFIQLIGVNVQEPQALDDLTQDPSMGHGRNDSIPRDGAPPPTQEVRRDANASGHTEVSSTPTVESGDAAVTLDASSDIQEIAYSDLFYDVDEIRDDVSQPIDTVSSDQFMMWNALITDLLDPEQYVTDMLYQDAVWNARIKDRFDLDPVGKERNYSVNGSSFDMDGSSIFYFPDCYLLIRTRSAIKAVSNRIKLLYPCSWRRP